MGDQQKMAFEGESKIDLFKKKEIRKVFDNSEWWFSVKDVIEALVDTPDGTRYVGDLRRKDEGLNARYSEITRTLRFQSKSGAQNTKFTNIEGIFRLMQSVPSKRAEPFKKWLAKVGFERVQEIQDPQIAIKRAMAIYRAKGYPESWIDARIPNKIARERLESEWSQRGIQVGVQYAILTNAISEETFGVTATEHKSMKGLKKNHPLRDNMTPIELTLTTLAEQATVEIARVRDAQGFDENKDAAISGGKIAGNARAQIEKQTQKSVVSEENYLTERQRKNASSDFPANLQKQIEDSLNVTQDD